MSNSVHLDADRLADLHEGLLDEKGAAAAREHLADCQVCSEDFDVIAGVPGVLAGVADVGAVPDDVVRRIDGALADAAAAPTPLAGARTVTPLRDGRRSGPRGMRLLQAAAVVVLLLAGGALGISALSGGDDQVTSGSAAGGVSAPEASTSRVPVTASGRNWTKADLASAGPAFAGRSLGPTVGSYSRESRAADGSGGAFDSNGDTPNPSTLAGELDKSTARLTGPAALTACVRNLTDGEDTPPLSVDLARFEGQPAAVFAFANVDEPSRVDLFVVAPDCPTGTFLYYASVPRS